MKLPMDIIARTLSITAVAALTLIDGCVVPDSVSSNPTLAPEILAVGGTIDAAYDEPSSFVDWAESPCPTSFEPKNC
jgi:hypothetical protein